MIIITHINNNDNNDNDNDDDDDDNDNHDNNDDDNDNSNNTLIVTIPQAASLRKQIMDEMGDKTVDQAPPTNKLLIIIIIISINVIIKIDSIIITKHNIQHIYTFNILIPINIHQQNPKTKHSK